MWRRAGESFLVGDGVEVEILDARANRVKLGIIAPSSVPIVRKEARITSEENIAAALSAGHEMIATLLKRVSVPDGSRNSAGVQCQVIDDISKIKKTLTHPKKKFRMPGHRPDMVL